MDIKEFAKIFNKTMYEEFEVSISGVIKICKFTEHGLYSRSKNSETFILDDELFVDLVTGDAVIKEHWKPKKNDIYYSVIFEGDGKPEVVEESWDNTEADFILFMVGNCFKTKELAEKKKNTVKEAIVGFYNTHNAYHWEED